MAGASVNSPICGLARTRPAVAGSSSRACTPSHWACHAPTGSSSTDGPAGSWMPEPAAGSGGSPSTRWQTTSRAVHPATGAGASHDRAPRTRSVNPRLTSRGRSAGRLDRALGEHLLELGVALVDPDLHAAGEPCVSVLEAVHKGLCAQQRPSVTEVLKPQRLQPHAVGLPLEGECLDDPVRPHVVEAATKRVLLPV